MAPRWSDDTTRWPEIAPSDDPRTWEEFLRDYFGDRGVWMSLAVDSPDHPMRPDLSVDLRKGFEWLEVNNEFATFCVRNYESPPFNLPKTRVLRVLSPGIVLAGNGEGDWARIDGHLTAADEKYLYDMDHAYDHLLAQTADTMYDLAVGVSDGSIAADVAAKYIANHVTWADPDEHSSPEARAERFKEDTHTLGDNDFARVTALYFAGRLSEEQYSTLKAGLNLTFESDKKKRPE